MAKPSLDVVLADPEFLSMDIEGKREVLGKISDKFKDLAPEVQTQALLDISNISTPTAPTAPTDIDTPAPAPQLKPSTVQTLAEREEFGRRLQEEAQRPTSQKIVGGLKSLGGALISPLVTGVKAIPETISLLDQPERIPATVLEGTRRATLDLGGLISQAARQLPNIAAQGPLGAILGAITPRTLSEQEIQQAFEAAPLQQAIAESRANIPTNLPFNMEAAFERAQPEVAEAGAQIGPLLAPLPGLKALKPTGTAVQVGRDIRAAVKPPNAQIASRVEKAASEEIGDIFNVNKNADSMGNIPLEGFTQSVKTVKNRVGSQIQEIQERVGSALTAGDDIASIIEKRAASWERAGQPTSSIQFMREKASELKGKATTINDLQLTVTLANQQRSPLFLKSRAAQDPIRASVENIVNEIIAEEGGNIINLEMKTIGGPEAAALRKKWSNLTVLERQADERVNKIINSFPEEAQPALLNAATSIEGIAGLFALVNGYASGLIPVASSLIKSRAKKAAKDLKDSNVLIEKTYKNLRNNPPPTSPGLVIPPRQPPPLPAAQAQSALDAQLAQELADLQQAQAIQAQTGTGSFAPSLEQILQTQGLEEQILNQQAAQRRLQGAIGESVAGVPYY